MPPAMPGASSIKPRLAKLAGVKAQIGYKCRSGKYGGTHSIVIANTLDRQFDVNTPDKV